MKLLFTGFSIERDQAGNLFVELRTPLGIPLIGIALSPVVMSAGYVLADAPLGYSWQVFGGLIFFVVVTAAGMALIYWQHSKSRVRVGIYRARSMVVIDANSGRSEIPIRDIDKAEFGTATAGGASAATIHRLEFVLRSGERVPSSAEYCRAGPVAREKVLDELTRELGVRSKMLL